MRLLLSSRTAFLYDLSSRSRDSHCALAPAITLPGTARGPPGPEDPFPARNPLVTYLLPARVATRSRGTHGKLGPRYATRSEPRSPLRTLQSRTTTPGTCHPCRLRLATCTSLHPRLPDMAQPTPARSAGPHPSPCTGRRVPHISPGYLPGLELPDVIVHASTNPAGSQIDRSLPRRIDPYWDPGRHRGDDLADPISPSMYPFIRSRELRRLKPLAAGSHGNSPTTKPPLVGTRRDEPAQVGRVHPNHPTLLSVRG